MRVCIYVCVRARARGVCECLCMCEVIMCMNVSPEEWIVHEIITNLSLHVAYLSLGDTTNDEYNL